MNLDLIVNNVVLSKVCSIKPNKDSSRTKNITLKVLFNNVTLKSVFLKALAAVVVQWQNGQGRKKFDTWTNNQTVTVEFKAPAATPAVDPEQAMIAKLASMSSTERIAYFEKLDREATGEAEVEVETEEPEVEEPEVETEIEKVA